MLSDGTVDATGAQCTLWKIGAQPLVLDMTIAASHPAAICEPDPAPPAAPLRLLAAGVNPPLVSYAVTSDPAFSASAAAKRAASTVLSVAKGFLFSATNLPQPPQQPSMPLVAVARHSSSWADDPAAVHGVINFADVTSSARKSVSAVLQRGRAFGDTSVNPSMKTNDNTGGSSSSSGGNNTSTQPHRNSPYVRSQRTPLSPGIDSATPYRQRSGYDRHTPRQLSSNARVIERVLAAPSPSSLFATCDSLGRIFVQDSTDLCVLRVLKGYRDAHVAWIVQHNEPLLLVYAPKLNVLEVHYPLEQVRKDAFRVLPGTMLLQSTANRAFCLCPDGNLYQVMPGRDATKQASKRISNVPVHGDGDAEMTATTETNDDDDDCDGDSAETGEHALNCDAPSEMNVDEKEPDYELIGAFTEAVIAGRASRAVECLNRVEDSAYQVSHLMATLVTCTTSSRTEIHIALASTASQIASNLKDPDLLVRFEAHRRLAEAFSLVAVDTVAMNDASDSTSSEYGTRLLEDDLGTGLEEFAIEELKNGSKSRTDQNGRRRRKPADATEPITCEQFILSHAIAPTFDLQGESDYEIYPRADLTEAEQAWLARAYFLKLVEEDAVNLPMPGREHAATLDVFQALSDYIGLSEAEIARQFVLFFLHNPLLPLLKTPVSLFASPLRCAVARLRSKFSRDVVNPIILDACETTTRVANAVLLIRLCAVHEGAADEEEESNPFLESLDRLGEVKLFRNMIAGSKVPVPVYEKFTARQCTGIPGDAERQAIKYLIEWDDYDRASKILAGMEVSRSLQNLDWHESASIAEAALHACRKRATRLISTDSMKVIPRGVLEWIQAASRTESERDGAPLPESRRNDSRLLADIRSTLLSAHQYMPDSSVDAVRCLQLAEAMTALIQVESERKSNEGTIESDDEEFFDAPVSHGDVPEVTGESHEEVPKVDRI